MVRLVVLTGISLKFSKLWAAAHLRMRVARNCLGVQWNLFRIGSVSSLSQQWQKVNVLSCGTQLSKRHFGTEPAKYQGMQNAI